MKFWSSILDLLVVLGVISGGVSAVHPVTVKLHDPAVLPCSGRCSGVVRWTMFKKPRDTLAECDQTSCRSVEEGYQMIDNQYLQGNFSLIITEADFSKRARYTCECDGKHQCDVHLRIEPVNTTVQIQPGDSLLLDLDMSEPMEVIYNSTGEAGRSSGQICTVKEGSLQCEPEYDLKASLFSALELRGMEESDSGVYTVRDSWNEEVIGTYTVAVRDGGDGSEALDQANKLHRSRRSAESNCPTPECAAVGVAEWKVVLLVVLLGAVIVVAVVIIVRLKRENQQLRLKTPQNTDVHYIQNGSQNNGHVNLPEQKLLTP